MHHLFTFEDNSSLFGKCGSTIVWSNVGLEQS